jgi:tryptophan halogenase
MRKQLWKKNCIAIGLAGGFLEPLESTAIHLAIRGVENLLDLFPNLEEGDCEWPVLAAEYNLRMRVEYEEIRDFIILHYHTSKRTGSEFWRSCQSMPVPDGLAAKIELFEVRSELHVTDSSLFKKSNWQAVLIGMGVIPRAWHPFVDMTDFDSIHQAMQTERARLHNAAQQLPAYGVFLNKAQGVADE